VRPAVDTQLEAHPNDTDRLCHLAWNGGWR
jgi:hypothetical protein